MAEHGRGFLLFSVLIFLISIVNADVVSGEVYAIVSMETESKRDNQGSAIVSVDTDQELAFVGRNLSGNTTVAFTLMGGERGDSCETKGQITKAYHVFKKNANDSQVFLNFRMSRTTNDGDYYYICVQKIEGSDVSWIHQGQDPLVRFKIIALETTLLPLWLQLAFIGLLLTLSGLFSGLNLGLMSLDKTELKIIERCGSPREKKYAKVISPLRKRGNFLLCTLLIGNVLVNNSLTILLDNVSNGLVAIIGATAFIVVFGEIVPQAICSRHGLAVGAHTRFITMLFMILTFPVSFPISLLLDKILGEEIGQVYNREKLQELIRVTKDISALDDDEVAIISGALTLTKKTVRDIMTPIEDVFLLDYNDVLNFEKMSEIMKMGYSRIPVIENDKSNIVALLNIKDLALIDPDDNTPLKTICKYYQHHLLFVFDDHKLDQMLQDFRQGHSHMGIVRRVNNEGDGDPYYETLGVVTLEDVIEEIIQSEIIDETDTLIDNSKKTPRRLPRQDFSAFSQRDDGSRHILSPQLSMAAFQFLSTSVEPFMEKFMSENVLRKLIKQNIVVELNPNDNEKAFIYKEGMPCDYFVLILEGHVEVSIGRESMVFQGGPFSFYGVNILNVSESVLAPASNTDSIYVKHEPYIPDFTVRATTTLLFLRIKRPHYIVARRATLMGRSQQDNSNDEEAFTKEWKHLSRIDQCNHNNVDANVDVHENDNSSESATQIEKKPSYSSNWTPLQSSTNISNLGKRTDSRDSGWSFQATDKHTDASGSRSDHDIVFKDNGGQMGPSVSFATTDSKSETCLTSGSKDSTSDIQNHERTCSLNAADEMKVEVKVCDNENEDDVLSSGEFTPLVHKSQQKSPAGAGDA